MRTFRPRSAASLMRLNSGGSHNTAKFTVMVFGNDARSKRWINNESDGTDTAHNRTPMQSHYGTVFVIPSLIAVRLDGTMSTGREIRSYDYVNRPYERVRDALTQNALTVFQSATKAAASRAQSIAAELHIDFGGIGVKTDINISVRSIEEKVVDTTSTPTTRLLLEWEAATMPRLFPLMKGELSVYPLTSTETQLDFSGIYEPPFGAIGKTMNAIIGHRIAEVSVHRFVSDVAGYLRQALA
jgi:hypothetical protein